MSAVVCGKRSFFEDLESAGGSSSPPSYKRFRCSSPARFAYSPPVSSSPVDQLKALFPEMDIQVILEFFFISFLICLMKFIYNYAVTCCVNHLIFFASFHEHIWGICWLLMVS